MREEKVNGGKADKVNTHLQHLWLSPIILLIWPIILYQTWQNNGVCICNGYQLVWQQNIEKLSDALRQSLANDFA
jgi:hypothetical protein